MESGSSQEINSDESDRSFQIESFHEHDFGDDELSQSNSICIEEDRKKIELSFQSSPSVNNAVDPYIGMEFQSRDDAREYYITYGRRIGFSVRIHHNRRSRINNMVIGQDFVCSKEGFREKKYVYRKDRILPPPPITREGCPAMLRLTLKDGVKWVVTKFIEEHNHGLLSPSKVPWRGSTKNIINEVINFYTLLLSEIVNQVMKINVFTSSNKMINAFKENRYYKVQSQLIALTVVSSGKW